MDFKTALNILELKPLFSVTELKKNYYKMALKWHPDKNNSPDANTKFLEISQAHELLSLYLNLETEDNAATEISSNSESESRGDSFTNLFNNFLSVLLVSNDKINKEQLVNFITTLTKNCLDKLSNKIFEGIDKSTCLKLFIFIEKYADILNINKTIISQLTELINQKYKNDCLITLNPNINNLFNNELYLLDYNDNRYYIPLWHDELSYDLSNDEELIIKMKPELEEHIWIDSNNDIHVNLTSSIKGLLTKKKIVFNLGEKVFEIPCDDLNISSNQTYMITGEGIPVINYYNIYDVSVRSDIIVNLTLHDN